MRSRSLYASNLVLGVIVFVLLGAGGCASVDVTDRQEYQGPKLARPDRIVIYDFAATPEDLPSWSAGANAYAGSDVTPSAQNLELGRRLGAEVAKELVSRIDAMGLPAERAGARAEPQSGEIAIVGYFVSMNKGSTAERLAIGFGEGGAQLSARVEGYQSTADGMRQLGAGTASSNAGKSPGLIAPLAVTVATANPIGLIVGSAVKAEGEVSGRDTIEGSAKRLADTIASELEMKFQEQGWIDGM